MNAADGKGAVALHLAARHGHLEVLGTLIKAGASLAATNANGFSGMHIAAAEGHAEVLRVLS